MNKNIDTRTVEKTIAAIFALDLEPIKFKLMSEEEGYGWSSEQADHFEREYKRFLALVVKYPEETIVPSASVDKFWHAHILDTMKYAADCEKVFGYFLHHYPYFGLRGEEDAARQADAVVTARRLYEAEFGAAGTEKAAYCAIAADKAAYCAVAADKAAYCAVAADKKAGQAAYCAVAVDTKVGAAAYCAASAGAKAEPAAYCAVAAGKPAYCAAVAGKPDTSAAYCAVSAQGESAAYCAVVAGKEQEASAYCAVASGKAAARGEHEQLATAH
ncbi:MAG TPA: hypothetical protein VJ698_02915 [Noviherbaspirillum sp.]|uniref:glycine-rich domain-containing protein n=1 Tax=Noviherbaspirillum sp. TaxID=1926288 RepID=UPI002B488CE5|nr:hypothetical protein [Noviherbaspirillum sp.]HJV84401.1 hypothetical protein [Noviherbaspirillum sp.]